MQSDKTWGSDGRARRVRAMFSFKSHPTRTIPTQDGADPVPQRFFDINVESLSFVATRSTPEPSQTDFVSVAQRNGIQPIPDNFQRYWFTRVDTRGARYGGSNGTFFVFVFVLLVRLVFVVVCGLLLSNGMYCTLYSIAHRSLSSLVQNSKFTKMGESIMGRMNEMNARMDELELSIGDLMHQAGLEAKASSSSSKSESSRRSEVGRV